MPQPPNPIFTPEYEHLRAALLAARRSSGLSQEAVAERIGRNKSHVALLEKGQRRVEFLEFYRLLRAMEHDPNESAQRLFEAFDELRKTGAPEVTVRSGRAG